MLREVLGRSIDEIDEAFLQSLVDDKITEMKTLDYKRQLPCRYDDGANRFIWPGKESSKKRQKIEFLKDISSFANADGGVIIYGIDDKHTGIPQKLVGLNIKDEHAERLKNTIDGIIRSGIAPRIERVNYPPTLIDVKILEDGVETLKKVFIIEIPRSWRAPHCVTSGDHNRFWSRSTAVGKYEMDVNQLRDAFILSETRTEKIRGFRDERISNLMVNKTPVEFISTHENPEDFKNNIINIMVKRGATKIALHLVPFNSFDPATRYDLKDIYANSHKIRPMLYGEPRFNPPTRYNLDGILTYSPTNKSRLVDSYTQLFRNGTIEAVEGGSHIDYNELFVNIRTLWIDPFERELIESLKLYLDALKTLQVKLPIYLFLTLLGVKGVAIYYNGVPGIKHKIDRDELLIPEVCIKSYEDAGSYNDVAEHILKDCFDAIWNACGYSGSKNYDKNGKYVLEIE